MATYSDSNSTPPEDPEDGAVVPDSQGNSYDALPPDWEEIGGQEFMDRLLEDGTIRPPDASADLGSARTWRDNLKNKKQFGVRTIRELTVVAWALFGSDRCEVRMNLGSDEDDDRCVFVDATFYFPKPRISGSAREPARVSFQFKVKDHPEYAKVNSWEREENPEIMRDVAIHLIRKVNLARTDQVAKAITRTVERHGLRDVKQMAERLRLEGWAALRRYA